MSREYRSEHDGHTAARRLLQRVNTWCSRPSSSRPAKWIGLAQNPTASTRCHQALKPAELARRIIWATTATVVDTVGQARQMHWRIHRLLRSGPASSRLCSLPLLCAPGRREPGGEVGDVGVGDVKGPDALRLGGAVDHHVTHTGGGVGDEVAFRACIPGTLAEHHRRLAGFGQAQPDPHGEQLPHGQGVFGRILDRGDDADADRSALGEQQPEQMFDLGAYFAVGDVGRQGGDFVDDHHEQRFGGCRGVQAGVPA